MKITLFLDAHVHLYPFYDLAAAFAAAFQAMPRRNARDLRALLLADREGMDTYRKLAADELAPPPGWKITAFDAEGALRLHETATGRPLWLIAGRQHATRERLELCTLFAYPEIPDGTGAEETLQEILRTPGAVAAVNWAPGKWLSKRGKLLKKLLAANGPDKLVLVDTSLRPYGWPEGSVFRRAKAEGRAILAGSDPLAAKCEETIPGKYRVRMPLELPDEPADDAESEESDASLVPALRAAVLAGKGIVREGARETFFSLRKRLKAHQRH
jgi:hypothetical protein